MKQKQLLIILGAAGIILGLLLTKSKFIILSQIFITSLLLVLDFTPYLIGGISNTTIYQLSLLVVLYGNR